MNSAHDLGGMMGFGSIENDPADPNFHAEWEQRVFALTLAVGATGSWNIDETLGTEVGGRDICRQGSNQAYRCYEGAAER